ncbi:FAD-dependent oxidoreductase [Chelatococcus sp. SYSU_G07232]|uniref:FAD-dependent oxidoreductase n=1 Tax=Chelatococcus albus TaxID=3047466 RepID=A0ABT7AHE0_9HYPH|nr:FAD-dependent oxidoreductase [Chelatococcus sp. SYSU_G07232]MDJ1158407.1 FAD-dependent oxidoreductase [Chelatococcus sp. SYSU_G07232]
MKVAVVGAGIVGATAAHALLDEGHDVLVVDREGPAAGPSGGNAGWIAYTDILPIASPKILRQVPRFLVDPLGPLAIRPGYLLPLLPWLARFVAAARPAAYERSITAIAALQALALPAWTRLAGQLGCEALIHRRGGLYVYDDPAAFARADRLAARQRELGITVERLGAPDLRRMEPGLSQSVVGAFLHPDIAHVSDPRQLTTAVFEAALARGAHFLRRQVTNVAVGGGLRLACDGADAISVDAVVLAAGAWSKPLAASLGDRIPLDTERGYNVSFPGVTGLVGRPIAFEGHGFVATPLDTGFRVGGAVEFGGLSAPPNHARTRAIHAKARRFLPALPDFEVGSVWMGFRPSIPDSLPVIGRARTSPKIVYAFGHGHYGLTQSAATARLVADLLADRQSPIDLAPYRPDRF